MKFRDYINEAMTKKQLDMIAGVVKRSEGKRKKLGPKPKKGDWVQDKIGGVEYMYEIEIVSKGYVYCKPRSQGANRPTFPIKDLFADHRNNVWIMKD
jgi:hypothetical protein